MTASPTIILSELAKAKSPCTHLNQAPNDECRFSVAVAELRVMHAIYSSRCRRFPWQLFFDDGQCVLVDREATQSVVIRSRFSAKDDAPLLVQAIPLDVHALVRQARRGISS